MNTLKIGLLAGMLTASSLAFSMNPPYDLRGITAQAQGCTLPGSVTGIPITLFTKHVDWYKYGYDLTSRKYYCNFKVPRKYRRLIDERLINNGLRCNSLDAPEYANTDYYAEVYINKDKILVICTVYDIDPNK